MYQSFAWNTFLQLGGDGAAEGTPVLVSMTASATLTRTQSMSPDCFISPIVSIKVPHSTSSRTDTVSSFCQVSPSVSPSTSPTLMPPPAKTDTVSSFCRISPSVSPVAPAPVGETLGKAGKVLGIPLEPCLGTSAWNGGKRVPLGEVKGVKEGNAEGADDQVITLFPFVLVEATNIVFLFYDWLISVWGHNFILTFFWSTSVLPFEEF